MSTTRVTDKQNDKRKKRKVSHVMPRGSDKFTASNVAGGIERMKVAIDGGEVRERSCKSYPPLRLVDDPSVYWQLVDGWGQLLCGTAAEQLATLEAATFTTSDGQVLTGSAARIALLKRQRSEYVARKATERAVKDPKVHQAIASNEDELKSVLDAADPAALERLLQAAIAKAKGES